MAKPPPTRVFWIPAAPGSNPPRFDAGHSAVHDQVRARMRSVLAAGPVPRYLAAAAVSLLGEARAAYARYKLADHMTVRDGADTVLFPWAGSRVTQTLAAQLTAAGLEASGDGLVITVLKAEPGRVRERLRAVAEAGPADPVSLALRVANKKAAKYDDWIDDGLLSADYACRALDCPGAWRQAGFILESWPAGL